MISFDEFEDMLHEIAGQLPEDLYKYLNGGVILSPEVKFHPESRAGDLFVLGEYCYNRDLGRYIKIYYESFCRLYGHSSPEQLREKLTKVLKHEFLHHMEALAGEKELEIEDAIFIAKYKGMVKD